MSKGILPKDSLHHAYIVEGDLDTSKRELHSFLKEHFNLVPGSADMFIFSYPDLGVDNVEEIISANLRKPSQGSRKVLIIDFVSISIQAQNSLLKTLEEPQQNTHIFLLTQTSSVFLPTVLSRVHVISYGDSKKSIDKDIQERALFFLTSSHAERLETIKDILKEKDDEEIGEEYIQSLVFELERQSHIKIETKDLHPFLILDEYIRDASSSNKLLLEYMALTLPRVRKA
jgi:DNA polymerase III delta prime subunit